MTRMFALAALTLACCSALASEELLSGYLCCNMHSDGKSINDINADDSDQHVIPAGTPIKVTAYHKHRAKVMVENREQSLINDYSRNLAIEDFTKRYIVQDDPRERMKTFPKNIQFAISAGHLVKGMTRDQVLMSVGYPVSSEVPNLNTNLWTFWITDKVQYRVKFDANDRLADIENTIDAKSKLLSE